MRRPAAALVAILFMALAPAALASGAGHLEILSPEAPGVLTFDASTTATITVTIRNATSADVTVTTRFVDSGTGATTDSASPVPARAGLVVLVAPVGAVTIPHGDTRALDVQFAAGPDTDIKTVAGVVIFETVASDVLGATLAVSTSKSKPFGTRFEPATVTINANRLWPSAIRDECDCWADWNEGPNGAARYRVAIPGATTVEGLAEVKTVLASDTGGRLEVSLRDFAIDHSGAVTGVVRLGESDRAGKYEGTLSVDPDDPKAAAITLTANVQDFFIWPLAAVLIGEGFAFGVAYWRDRRRAREILEAGLTKAKQEFDDALLTGELTERERSWFDGVLEPPGTSRAAVTLAQIRKAPSKEDLNSQAKDSGEVVAIWESLSKLRNAVASLKEQLDKNRHIDTDAAVFAHAIELLAPREMGFATSADVKSYGQELSDQTAAITNLVRAHAELERGERLWAQLAASARATLYREDPLAYWREGVRPLRTNQELTDDDVLQRLRDRNVAILGYLFAHPGAMRADSDEAPEFGPFKNLIRAYWAAPAGGLRIPLTYEDIFPRPLERIVPPLVWRDPKVILVRVRSFDRIEFWLSFALGLVTTFLLLYQDKNFGTGLQYLGAIATGFAATTAVLQLLPWYRSYKADAPATSPA